jgi:hypothetical protein
MMHVDAPLFGSCAKASLMVVKDSSATLVRELDFLGYHVDASGICLMEDKVQVIHDFPRPIS